MVRTLPFQGSHRGSIPRQVNMLKDFIGDGPYHNEAEMLYLVEKALHAGHHTYRIIEYSLTQHPRLSQYSRVRLKEYLEDVGLI